MSLTKQIELFKTFLGNKIISPSPKLGTDTEKVRKIFLFLECKLWRETNIIYLQNMDWTQNCTQDWTQKWTKKSAEC